MKTNERPQYITQLNIFNRMTEAVYLPPNAQLLWYKLIGLCNRCGWPEWMQVDALRIMRWIGARDVKSAYRARDALVAAGLLEYRKGSKGYPNSYRLIFFPDDHGRENAGGSAAHFAADPAEDGTADRFGDRAGFTQRF